MRAREGRLTSKIVCQGDLNIKMSDIFVHPVGLYYVDNVVQGDFLASQFHKIYIHRYEQESVTGQPPTKCSARSMEVKLSRLQGNCDRIYNRQTNRQTDELGHREVSLPIISCVVAIEIKRLQ